MNDLIKMNLRFLEVYYVNLQDFDLII